MAYSPTPKHELRKLGDPYTCRCTTTVVSQTYTWGDTRYWICCFCLGVHKEEHVDNSVQRLS